jgi:amidophosphoribosyltransferase
VHLRLSSPPFKHQCFYGTDIDKPQDLIANRVKTIQEIGTHLGADSIGYISMPGLKNACQKSCREFCHKCFTGN